MKRHINIEAYRASHPLFWMLIVFIFALQGCASSYVAPSRPDIHNAALYGDVEKTRNLIQSGANINSYDDSGFSPIHWAAASGFETSADVVRLLVSAGANPDMPHETTNQTPLHFVSRIEAAQALIEVGASLEVRAIDNATPIFEADTPEMVQLYIDNGADTTVRNGSGRTPAEHYEYLASIYRDASDGSQVYTDLINSQRDKIAVLGGSSSVNQTPGFVTVQKKPEPKVNEKPRRDELLERQMELERLISAQVCAITEGDWIYTSEACEGEVAHGNGTAVHREEPFSYEGEIVFGALGEGILFEQEEPIYEGKFKNGMAHGNGVCYYEGEPEECRYFKGKRIDTLHRQRLEFDRQQELVSSRSAPVRSTQQAAPTAVAPQASDTIGDQVQDELIKQGAKAIFDHFF